MSHLALAPRPGKTTLLRYRKLDASSRGEAVERSRTVSLL
jgi:hypothetical protein